MVSGNAPPTFDGVGDFTARLLEHLARQRPDWRWSWLARRPRRFASLVARCSGVTLYRPAHTWTRRGRALACWAVRALRPDVLHVQEQIHSFHETGAAVELARSTDAPLVTTLHEYHTELPSVVHTNDLVRRSDVIISNDPRNAERCLEQTGRAVDHHWWTSASVLPPAPADRPPVRPGLVATFGFLSAIKSMGLLHQALRTVRESRPDVRWRVIGPFEPATNPHHAALARSLGPDASWIELTGGVVDHARLRTMLAEAEVMLLPFADGATVRRTTLHVAWAFGLPVVTTPPDRPTDAVTDGENCVLVHAPTPDAWASAVTSVLCDRPLADRLRAGSLKAAERFSWDRLAAEHVGVYEDLLARQSGRT